MKRMTVKELKAKVQDLEEMVQSSEAEVESLQSANARLVTRSIDSWDVIDGAHALLDAVGASGREGNLITRLSIFLLKREQTRPALTGMDGAVFGIDPAIGPDQTVKWPLAPADVRDPYGNAI